MKQLARFILVGASGTLLQLLLMFIIVDGFSVPVLVANIISFIIVVTWNYLWNSRITFQDRQIGVVKWIKYVVGNLMGLLVQEIVLFIALKLKIPYLLATVAAVGVAFLVNYAISRRFVWQIKKPAS